MPARTAAGSADESGAEEAEEFAAAQDGVAEGGLDADGAQHLHLGGGALTVE